MKNIWILALLMLGLWSCQKDETLFSISIPQENLSFRPVAGGAVMYYKLPADKDVYSIRVRYSDAFGEELLRTGSALNDSLLIVGFNEAQQGVKARVTLCDRNNVESEPVEVTFDTEDSGPVAFFQHLEVRPNWNGFMVSYDVPENANGMAHVFYVGKDPMTQEPDTLLVSSFLIKPGKETLNFFPKQSFPYYDIVVRTEDFRGYIVKQEVWEHIEIYKTAQLSPSEFDILDPCQLSVEVPEEQLGIRYLTDGDTKGETCLGLSIEAYNTYLAGPECIGKPLLILDFKEPKQISEVRIYALLEIGRDFATSYEDLVCGPIWDYYYYDKLPCKVSIYMSNDKDDESSWKEVSKYEEERELAEDQRWCSRCSGLGSWLDRLQSVAAIEAAEPCYMPLYVNAAEEPYRYMKIVVNDIFIDKTSYVDANKNYYVTFHELEVYSKTE